MLKSVRGMHDLLPNSRAHIQHEFISGKAIEIAQRYNYKPIYTPHVEFAGLFERTLGTTSDVIKKEMFLLKQNNESEGFDEQNNSLSSGTASEQIMCLRPEGTAGVVRSVIQHNLYNSRLFYMGNMYRYERPQKGRLRQFTQFGIERIGEKVGDPSNRLSNRNELHQDIEVLQMACSFLSSIGVMDRVRLELNSLGSLSERIKYEKEFLSFLREYEKDLSQESQNRLKQALIKQETQQIWRILDSKMEEDQELFVKHNAPLLSNYYSSETAEKFEALKETLRDLGISFTINPYLVRGLDYYSYTTFEFKSTMTASSNNMTRNVAVLAGGRYDGLFPMLGAKNEVDAIGWAAGIERLSILLEDIDEKQLIGKQPFTIGVIGLTGIDIDTKVQNATMSLTQKLRNSNELLASKFVVVGPVYTSKVLNGLQKLEKEGCSVAVLLGSREIENGTCSIKNMLNRNLKDECKVEQIIESLNKMYESLLI